MHFPLIYLNLILALVWAYLFNWSHEGKLSAAVPICRMLLELVQLTDERSFSRISRSFQDLTPQHPFVPLTAHQLTSRCVIGWDMRFTTNTDRRKGLYPTTPFAVVYVCQFGPVSGPYGSWCYCWSTLVLHEPARHNLLWKLLIWGFCVSVVGSRHLNER